MHYYNSVQQGVTHARCEWGSMNDWHARRVGEDAVFSCVKLRVNVSENVYQPARQTSDPHAYDYVRVRTARS